MRTDDREETRTSDGIQRDGLLRVGGVFLIVVAAFGIFGCPPPGPPQPPETVQTPEFTPDPGTYDGTAQVTIRCATGGATIRYTADGNDPTPTSTEYTSPIDLTYGTTLKARAYKDGMTQSDVAAAQYAVRRTVRVSVTSDGTQATNGQSSDASISADGRHVAFESSAHGLVSGDINQKHDVFVRDRDADGNGIYDEDGAGKNLTICVSIGLEGQPGNDLSLSPCISANGRHVAFTSYATDLVAGDTNDKTDVFVYDRDPDGNGVFDEAGQVKIVRVNVASDGSQADRGGSVASLSSNGRFVAFMSSSTNLVPEDSNAPADIFVHDRDADEDGFFDEADAIKTTRMDIFPDGGESNLVTRNPIISANGRYVAFQSFVTNLVPGDTNSRCDVFVYDRDADADGVFDEPGETETVRVSVRSDGTQVTGGHCVEPEISADGRHIAFISEAADIVPGDTNGATDYFVHDRDADGNGVFDEDGAGKTSTVRVSVKSNGDQTAGHDPLWLPPNVSISGDGRFVAFNSVASNVVPDDSNGRTDGFVHDRDADENGVFDEEGEGKRSTVRVSVASDGAETTDGGVWDMSLSYDGRHTAFSATGSNLVTGDTNGGCDVFVHDRGR